MHQLHADGGPQFQLAGMLVHTGTGQNEVAAWREKAVL
jgi:hypothetical protein